MYVIHKMKKAKPSVEHDRKSVSCVLFLEIKNIEIIKLVVVNMKNNVDISNFLKLIVFIKHQNVGYRPKIKNFKSSFD